MMNNFVQVAWIGGIFLGAACSKPTAQQPTTPNSQVQSADASSGEKSGSGEAEAPKQTYEEAWTVICKAQELSGVDPKLPTAEYNSEVVNWLVAHLKNQKARLWFLEYDKVKPENKRQFFESEAAKVGLETCELTALLFPSNPIPTPSP